MPKVITATPNVWCDQRVGIELAPRGPDIGCDIGAEISGQEVLGDPGVRMEPVQVPLPEEDAPDIWAFVNLQEDEEAPPELPLPRFELERAHIPPPMIPERISNAERRSQRVKSLADRFGWDEEDERALLDEVLADGVSEGHLARLVEENDSISSERLNVAWQVRRDWFEEGPSHHAGWDVKLTWHCAALLVLRREADDVDELLALLDDAYQDWTKAGSWGGLVAFHDELTSWLTESEHYDIVRHNFPW